MRTTERSKKKLTVWSYHRDGRTLQRATELQIFTQITSFQSLKNVGDYSEKMATVFNWRECKHPQSKSELSHCFIWNSMRWSSTWTHQKCVTALNVSSSSNSNHGELSQPYMLGPNPELLLTAEPTWRLKKTYANKVIKLDFHSLKHAGSERKTTN